MARNQVVQLAAVGTIAGAAFVAAKNGYLGTGGQQLAQQIANDWGAAFGRGAPPKPLTGAPPAQGPGPGGVPGTGTQTTATPHGPTGSNTLDPSPDTASSTVSLPTGTHLIPTNLVDMGGFPVVYDPQRQTLRQDPSLHGTNIYDVGDVFVDVDTQQWQWVGATQLRSLSSGQTAQLQAFVQS